MASHVVTALKLNLRSAPDPTRNNVILVLPQGTELTKVGDSSVPGWIEVTTQIVLMTVRGFVASSQLGPLDTAFPVAAPVSPGGRLAKADLGPKASARRDARGSWANRIGEAGLPGLPSAHPAGPVAGILAIIDWLNVGSPAHLRWKPSGSTTYCNIYAHDTAMAAGCYLPRVWWTSSAIAKLVSGQIVPMTYGTTVNEMRANAIFDWLEEYGADFGWQRVVDVDDLQSAANAGCIGIVCAQRTEMNRPGHIQIVAPEHGSNVAKRSGGKVVQPLQSQAGSRNFNYGFLGNSWWLSRNFREFGFWHCATG
jgi:hypothetical protein